MTSENIMKERWDQLGLPPMELAESSENNSRANSGVYKCLPPLFHKLVIILLLTSFGVGTYVLLLRLSENYDYARNTEIIILTGNNEIPNVTVHNMEIFLQFKNGTADQNLRSKPKERRKKRHTSTPVVSSTDIEDTIHFNDEQLQKAREIILNHDVLCNKEETQEICKNFVTKLKAIGENDDESKTKQNPSRIKLKVNEHDEHDAVDIKEKQNNVAPTDLTKREAFPNSNLDSILKSVPTMHLEAEARDASPYTNAKVLPHSHSISPQHLSETCLLARLLKQNYPSAKGIYDPSPAYLAPHYEHQLLPKSRYYSPDMHAPYLQERDIDLQGITMHPQDVNIVMSLLTSKSEPAATARSFNSSREISCPTGTLPCLSGDACVEEKQWCDGNVDCIDVSDEARCACKARVDKSRLCDGYFDCPFGEDEMGCYGCSETMFSCEDLDMNSRSTCFTKEQRCNNVVDCPNHKDEVECNMLAPSLLKKPLFAISNTEGFLHRNFKGDWFAVCKNPYMWAHDACRRETGLIIRPPFIQILPIDPMMKINYLNTGPGGLIQTSDTCMNSSAVYVTCPDLLCGTRVQSTSQLLREDAAIENRLFGRNKRFLLKNHPYPFMFYGNRLKRDVNETRTETNNYEIKFDRSKRDFFDTMRKKRTESRVVGGKPSQPAAWPWMIALYRNGMFHCGGVVITHSWVVSAAHCVHKFWEHYYEVQVGMLRRFSFSPQEKSHKVTHVIVNPHYSQTDMKNDLSLLKVEPAIQFSRWVRPICLPNPDTAGPDWLWGPAPGTICTSVGWGSTTEHGPDPDHMRDVEVPIWANCKHREDRVGNEICAGLVEGGRDACQGDSGGPLLCRNPLNSQQWYMAGIVSHGDGCGRKDEPGVYTRVSLFVKWIKYHISSQTLPKFQPIQECPGFKCETGISKCLPNKRKCDKIVDCLDGEDETNCEFTRSVTTLADSIFVDSKSSLEKLLESKEVQTESPLTSSSDKNQEDTTPATIPSDNDVSTENGEIVTSTNIIHTSHKKRENFDLQSEESTHAEKKYFKHEKNTSQSKESIDTEKLDVERKGNPIDNPKSKESTNAEKLDFENEEKINDKLQSKESTDAENLDFNHESNPIDNPKSKESTNANKLDFKNEENISDNLKSKESTDAENLDFNHEGNPIDNPKSKEPTNANKLDFKNEENISDNLKSKESTDTENLDFNHEGNPIDNPKSKESTNANKLDVKNEENISDNLKSKESTDAENLDFNHEGNPIDNPKSKEPTNANKLDFKNEENISDNLKSKESTDTENLDFNHEGNPIDNPKSKESTNANKLDFKNEENISDNLKNKESTDAENLDFNHEGNPIDNPKSKESTNANKLDFKNEENISDNLQSKESTDAENLDFNHEDNPIDKPKSKESTDADELNVKNEKNLSDHPQSQESTVADIEHKENPTDHSQSEDSIDAEKQNLKHEENPITNTQLKKSTDTKKPDFEHASTIEIINDESSENFFNSEETATADPKSVTSTETTSPSRGDAEMITMDFSVVTLESGSSVLEQIKETTTRSQPNGPEDINTDSDDDNNKIENVFENKLETSTAAFTHNNFIEPIEKNEPTTPSTRPKNLPDINLGKKDENESGFLVKLLPNFNSTVTDKEGIETILINDDNNVTDSDLHQDTITKKLPNFNDKSDTIKIEDLIFSDLQPAKVRRKHRNPNEFECRRIEQTIPYQHRCDRKADCEDGTDELDCTCTDFLLTFDENLICDGIIDCIDGQDELDCFSCPEDHFLCQRSQICLPEKHVCDGKTECLQGEDELNCFALTNGKDIEFDLDDRPTVNLEGYLTKKHFNDWHIVCDDKLSIEQQEEAATHICRYLGFSSANRYNVKYLNLKEDKNAERSLDNKRNRRDTKKRVPIHFAYRQESEENDTLHTIIKDPQIIKEECIPNITKTCKSLYVFCDNSLFNNFDDSENRTLRETESVSNYTWPWIAKVFVEGDYRCTGVLVNLTWVLVSDSCLWDSTLSHHYITVVLGSHRTLGATNGLHEQVYQVNSKKDVYRSKATLLHLREPAHYSNVVKPMVVASSNSLEQKSICVAVGQDNKNNTISVFLEETSENCHPSNRCFKRKSSEYICPLDVSHHRHWAGIVSCHTEQGWYPAATFVDGRGECGLGDHINATDIENLKNEIKYHYGKKPVAGLPALIDKEYADDCAGIRCGRGRCVPLLQVCNGVRECEDGNDEAEEACGKKNIMCNGDPYHKGCECSVGQMKCRNGKCISKELFRDGNNDCGDGTDEPGQTICKDYLATVMPSRLCDGILHCHDRSDEDPAFCKCFAKRNYKCGSKSDVDHCVAPDTVCDGVRDCPNGEDEQTCMALNAPYGTPYGTGQIIVRSHGVWHSKCYASQNHTKSELEAICSELGFFSGHAKQIKEMKNFVVHPYNNLVLDPFNEIILNNNTIIKMRNNHEPLAKAVFDEVLPNCYPVFIECR